MSEFSRLAGISRLTVGVSGNIIDASLRALADAITDRLIKVGVVAR